MTRALRAPRWPWLAVLAVTVLGGCGGGERGSTARPARGSIMVTSHAFAPGGRIPRRFTCDGADVSPPLSWSAPRDATELAIVMRDVDVPGRTFLHWVVTGLPRGTRSLGAGQVPGTASQLTNSIGTRGYRGPCPPPGDPPHRYVFTLYALAQRPGISSGTPPQQAEQAIMRAARARGSLTGTYGR